MRAVKKTIGPDDQWTITHWKCHVRGHSKLEVKGKIIQFLIKAKSYVTAGTWDPCNKESSLALKGQWSGLNWKQKRGRVAEVHLATKWRMTKRRLIEQEFERINFSPWG